MALTIEQHLPPLDHLHSGYNQASIYRTIQGSLLCVSSHLLISALDSLLNILFHPRLPKTKIQTKIRFRNMVNVYFDARSNIPRTSASPPLLVSKIKLKSLK